MLAGGTAGDDNVAIIVAAGEILFGSQPPGPIGSDSTAALLRRAHNDESVRAVVLRVDSPGGSSFASEVIADEIRALQDDGIPVVASMSSVAASGGYVISVDADRIVASPATITGSIGVFGMFPTFQRTLSTLGVATDGVGTTPWSGALRADREMSDQSRALFQATIEDTYEDFVGSVAANRGMTRDAVDLIGQGQVWTGAEALDNGLVDELGELDDAIAQAARLAGLEDYGTKLFEQQLSSTEQILLDLLSVGTRLGVDVSAFARRPSALESLANDITAGAQAALRFNDPKGIYSHCFCEIR
jgi:protease-4